MAVLSAVLTLLVGPAVPVPASPALIEALEQVEVTTSDRGRSGFQLRFAAGRSGPAELADYPLLTGSDLNVFDRVVVMITFGGGTRQVLMDGVITHRELTPGTLPGTGMLTITGEDVSVMMDLEERVAEHPSQDEASIATALIGRYSRYGLVADVVRPSSAEAPAASERVPVQRGTDLAYLQQMVRRFGHVFYLVPGPQPASSTAYWGPPVRTGTPQPALSVNLGAETNVVRIAFRANGLGPIRVTGQNQDPRTGAAAEVSSQGSTRTTLAAAPDWQNQNVRTTLFCESGLSTSQALARAQGAADDSSDSVTVTGTVDTLRYGHLLVARGLAGLRGAGRAHDGLYYVQQVTHRISVGEYLQDFVLTRDGSGSTVSVVQA